MCLFALGILYRICVIQFAEGDLWRAKAEAFTTKVEDMEAVRGNIFDANGALLATSLPYYEIAVDINAPGITEKLYKANRDSLALMMSGLFHDKGPREYLKILNKARRDNDRYVLLKRNVSYKDLQTLKTFPIFRKGKREAWLRFKQIVVNVHFKCLPAEPSGCRGWVLNLLVWKVLLILC